MKYFFQILRILVAVSVGIGAKKLFTMLLPGLPDVAQLVMILGVVAFLLITPSTPPKKVTT